MRPVLVLRRSVKVLHTLGAAGFMGAMGAVAVVLVAPPPGGAPGAPPTAALAQIAAWVVAPSMVLTVVSGLLAMLANPAFYEAAWVWLKAATGILVLEGGLHVLGPLQEEAHRGAGGAPTPSDPAVLAGVMTAEANTLWVLLAVSAANVVLGVWRPFFRLAP